MKCKMKAIENLRKDHESIMLMLKIMEQIAADLRNGKVFNIEHYRKIIEFINGFIDKCHHGKEESIFFPAVAQTGMVNERGQISMLLYDHILEHEYIQVLHNSIDGYKENNDQTVNSIILASTAYTQLLRNHIKKENLELFPLAEEFIDEKMQEKMSQAFEEHEENLIGKGKHEEYHKLLTELNKIYL